MTKSTWIKFGRQPGETDEEWAAVCKEMARLLQRQFDERRAAEEANARSERKL